MGEPETGVPTRYCLTSTQDPKPQFYAAANYGWFSSADQPLTWTANSPLAGPLRPFSPPSSSGLAVESGTAISFSPKVPEISGCIVKWGDEERKILLQIWAEHFLDLKKKRTKAVWEKITQDLKELCKDLSEFSPKSTSRVKTKIKKLTDAYEDAKTKNSQTGNAREISPYFEVIDEFPGTREATRPTHVLEVSDMAHLHHQSGSPASSTSRSEGEDDSTGMIDN